MEIKTTESEQGYYMSKKLKSFYESLFYLVKAFRIKMKDLDSFNKLWPRCLLSGEVFSSFH